jgi:hypothetical protein
VKGKKRARIQAAIDLLTAPPPKGEEHMHEQDMEWLWGILTAAAGQLVRADRNALMLGGRARRGEDQEIVRCSWCSDAVR